MRDEPPVSSYLRRHFRHFNASELIRAADGWRSLLDRGGRMMLTLGGAMSTAELGVSLAELIRHEAVHAICCTGANLEEDVFQLIGGPSYVPVPNHRDLDAGDEMRLHGRGLSRITDVCVPSDVMSLVERELARLWAEAEAAGRRTLPHEFLVDLLTDDWLSRVATGVREDSWLLAAARAGLPLFAPGWEDSTLGNAYAARMLRGDRPAHPCVKSGIDYMLRLSQWYTDASASGPVGFFQIGGGIAGDFAICVVPMLREDLGQQVPHWSYFAQVSDSTTSYGSYSGALPREKVSWGKLNADTPMFMIESDATIVFPLIAALVLRN